MKKYIKGILVFAAFAVVISYVFFLLILPEIFSSPENIIKYEIFISNKIGIPVSIKGLELKTYPNLSFKILSNGIYAVSKDEETLAHIDNLIYKTNLLNIKHGKFSSDYIYADIPVLKKYIKTSPKIDKKPLNLTFLPKINVKKGYIKFTDKTYADIDYIKSKSRFGHVITTLSAKIYNPYTKNPVIIGKGGSVKYFNKIIFDNFSINLDDSKIFISGESSNLRILGNNLPVKELEKSFLYFYKLKNSNKRNFIENFTDFQGTLDVDLTATKDGFIGNCTAHNLGANFSNFKIPVFLPKTIFKFNDRQISSKTSGTFGGEPVTTDFLLTGLMSKDLRVKGNVNSKITNNMTHKYYPAIKVFGVADAEAKYYTHNGKVDVYYTIKVNKGNNLLSDYGNLDNIDKSRKITVHTEKQGTPIVIKDYDYTILSSKGNEKLLYGDGLFDKVNGHYKLTKLAIKSNGKIPVNYFRSFLRDYIENGTFDTDLQYEFLTKNLTGKMNLYDVSHENFLYLKFANMNILGNKVVLNADGTFYNSPIKLSATASNKFKDSILIHNIDVHLNSFFVQRGKLTNIPQSFNKGNSKSKTENKKKIKIDVEQGRVVVDKIYSRKFNVSDVNIQGALKNEIANFIIPHAVYAKGLLSAKGIYNLTNHSSDIQFFASDIDSNQVVTEFFKLPDQVVGDAYATLHVKTKNKLNDIKAQATFAISDGYLPKISSQEFIIGKTKKKNKKPNLLSKLNIKISLSNIINIDFSKPDEFYTNIYGSFNMDNDDVKDVKIFSKSDLLALFIEGCYNIDNQSGNLDLWGRRNKTRAKKIRIFKIPINLIYRIVFKPEHTKKQYEDKIKLIPQIKSSLGDDIAIFRVSVFGNLNEENSLKVILKDLR